MSRNPSKYNKKPIPKELRLNGNAVEALAQEMGIPFRRYRNPRQQIVEDASQRDPDIAYLVDPVDTTDFDCDAMLYWKNRNNTLSWDDATKASVRQILAHDGGDVECVACYEDIPIREILDCTKCKSHLCPSCLIDLSLNTPEKIDRILSGNFDSGHECPECRNQSGFDFRSMYYRVLDRLEEFSSDQQRAIKFADHNHSPPAMRNFYLDAWIEKHPLKFFKPGVTFKVRGLKSKRKWNGQKAKIIGDLVINNDILRWPVQLFIGKKREKALLKQGNMTPPLNAVNLYNYNDPY